MYISQPITWLFIIATIMVNLVIVSLGPDRIYDNLEAAVIGYVIGQITALAIWTVRGRNHRLTRVSSFIVLAGLVTRIVPLDEDILALLFVFALVLFLLGIIVELIRHLLASENKNDNKLNSKWRYPIIEFFGWTIVIAVASLATRQMDFGVFVAGYEACIAIGGLIAVPFILVITVRKDLRDVRAIPAIIIVGLFIAATFLGDYTFVFIVQAAYLIAWLTVLTLDNIRAEALQVESALQDETPKLYDPQ